MYDNDSMGTYSLREALALFIKVIFPILCISFLEFSPKHRHFMQTQHPLRRKLFFRIHNEDGCFPKSALNQKPQKSNVVQKRPQFSLCSRATYKHLQKGRGMTSIIPEFRTSVMWQAWGRFKIKTYKKTKKQTIVKNISGELGAVVGCLQS